MHDALKLLFPPRCVTCQSPGTFHCSGCNKEWNRKFVNYIDGVPIYSAALYSHSVAHILMRAKEDNDRRARAVLIDAMSKLIPVNASLIPIPSSRDSLRRRGFDHALLLARGLDPKAEQILEVRRKIADQTALSHEDRHANLHGAYWAGNLYLPRTVLIDDVVTTGSSIREALRALREAKISPIAVVTAGLATHPIPNTIGPRTTGGTVEYFGQDSSRRRRSGSQTS